MAKKTLTKFIKRYPLTIAFLCCGFLYWVSLERPFEFSGSTMGTQYNVKGYARFLWLKPDLNQQVMARLHIINKSMSTYDHESEVSRFNQLDSAQGMVVAQEFVTVYKEAKDLHLLTGGVFEPTIDPLLRLWGFGVNADALKDVPDAQQIQGALNYVNFDYIVLKEGNSLFKLKDGVVLDFSSIAKGYAVDQLAHVLEDAGIRHYYVEIGGELRVSGRKASGDLWRIGINTPSTDASKTDVLRVLNLTDKAVATSGSYRQVYQINGRRYSHIINPKTGWPVDYGLVSVTVVADTCMFADGLATALMGMPLNEGLRLVNSLSGVEALFISESLNGVRKIIRSNFWTYEF